MRFLNFKSKDQSYKRRLEAFLDGLPFEYCGWGMDGVAVWSKKFPELFGLNSIQNIRDIQHRLFPSDAAALEGMIFALKKDGEPFTLRVKTSEDLKIVTLRGMRGGDLDDIESYDILWAEDTTPDHHARNEIQEKMQAFEYQSKHYLDILNALPIPIWTRDLEHKISWCNDHYKTISDNNELTITLNDDDGDIGALMEQTIHNNHRINTTGRIIVDGERRLMDVNIMPDNSNRQTVQTLYDITEQEELRSQLNRYVSANAELLEQLSTAIAIFGADHKIEFYNHAFSDLWGLEGQWLDSHPVLGDILEKLREERKLPEQADFKSYKKTWLDMFTSLIAAHQDMMHLPDGKSVRLMVIPHPMGGLMMTFEDVTSRLELESSYNTLIAVQKETLDNLGEGVAVFGSEGRLQLYNPSYLKIWKLNPEDMDTKPHITHLADKKKNFFKTKSTQWSDIRAILINHVIDRSDKHEKIIRSDGSTLDCRAVSLPDGGVMVTYHDITDSSRMQDVLEEKNQALLDAEKLKTDFLANVSYQLRTPLNAISGFSEILNAEYFGEINDKQKEYTQGITDAANRLALLINDILDLSTIEAGYLRLDTEPTDVKKLLDDVYELTRDWAGMETLKIKYQKPKNKFDLIDLDPTRLKQAVMNIIRNAISYTPAGGVITLQLEKQDSNIAIIISDTGIGISEDDQDKIFQPFQTSQHGHDNTTYGTTGLGLSLAKNIVAMHGGDVDVQSTLGEGTIVTITIPSD